MEPGELNLVSIFRLGSGNQGEESEYIKDDIIINITDAFIDFCGPNHRRPGGDAHSICIRYGDEFHLVLVV